MTTMTKIVTYDPHAFGFDGSDGILIEHDDDSCPEIAGHPLVEVAEGAMMAQCPVCVRGMSPIVLGAHGARREDVVTEQRPFEPRKAPRADATPRSPEEILGAAEAFLVALGRKVEVSDVTRDLQRAAEMWLFRYEGDFEFLVSLKGKSHLSDAQAKGVLNCWRADINRGATASAPKADNGPTDKQVDYLKSLMDSAGYGFDTIHEAMVEAGQWTRQGVSAMIDSLRNAPKVAKPASAKLAESPVPEGIHFYEGNVFKVQVAVHGSGQLYTKMLNKDTERFEYAGQAPMRHLSSGTLMTLQQAQEFGRLYGVCANCGRLLTDEDSITRGLGPVCARKFS